MKARHMHVNIQSRIKKLEYKQDNILLAAIPFYEFCQSQHESISVVITLIIMSQCKYQIENDVVTSDMK